MQTPPFNLGTAGRSLVLRLWLQHAGGTTAADVSGATIADLTTGEYIVSSLPEAVGSDSYSLVIADASDPAAALYLFTWGGYPIPIVFRQQFSYPQDPQTIKQSDSFGSLALIVKNGLPSAISSATASFTLWSESASSAVFNNHTAVISGVLFDATSGTYGCTLIYTLSADGSDTELPGRYRGQFTITFPGGTKINIPSDDSMVILINAVFGGVE